MSIRAWVCEEYDDLLEELTAVVQLCAEYENPGVLSIDAWRFTPEQAEQLHDAAVQERLRLEARLFIHQCTCMLCLHAP
jgi:hypothetical protein